MVKIEAGKYYLTREGEKVGPMERNNGIVDIFPFATYDADGERINSYTANGSVNLDPIDACGSDIISELSDFDPNWPHGHVTRDGRKARIVCTDAKGDNPIVALIDCGEHEYTIMVKTDGSYLFGDHSRLINAPPPKREWWVNVYRDRIATVHDTEDAARAWHAGDRLACVHVTEGDGL